MKENPCDGCCYKHNNSENLKCDKTVCCYLSTRNDKKECLVYEKGVI